MRRNRPGSPQSAVRAAITAAGGLECVRDDIGVSVATLSRATDFDDDRPGGLGINHLHQLGIVVSASAEPIARHFATLAGGIFQPIPQSGDLVADINELTLEFSAVLQNHAEAHSQRSEDPSDYTAGEARCALDEVDKLITACAKLRAALLVKSGD